MYHELPEKVKDPKFRREIGVVISPDEHPELLFDQIGLLVRWQLMEERFIMEYGGARAQKRLDRFSQGNYPPQKQRMGLTERWPADEPR